MCFEPRFHRASTGARRLAACLLLAPALALGLALTGCGNKRPPKPPPRMVAATTTDLDVAQRGSELQFSFAYPAVTVSGLPMLGLEAVELWRLTKPLTPPVPEELEGEETATGGEEPEAEEIAVEEVAAEEPPQATSPFLFRRPTTVARVQAEEKVQADPRELLALGEVEQRVEGAELQAAISGDRILLRLPLGELPPAETPEEERSVEMFAVITINSRGRGSEVSNVVKIMPRTPPPAPSQIETQPSADGINVVWRGDEPPVGFRVYRRDAASRAYGTPIAQPAPDAHSHLDRTASFDSSYVYSVTAVGHEAPLVESALAGQREVKYEDRYAPAPPSGLIAFSEPGRARVLWEPSVASDLAGYLVYRRSADGSGFDRLTTEPGLELEYLDEALSSGRRYSYYVSAVDLSGNESEASETVDVEVP